MKINLASFIGFSLSFCVFLAFLLEYVNNIRLTKLKKEIQLEKRQCELCSSVYFVSLLSEFWHCPLCGSINRKSHQKPKITSS